jgi:hypothetical protein
MKAVLSLFLVLTACNADSSVGPSPEADQSVMTNAIYHYTEPLDRVFANPCTGEAVHLTGELRSSFRILWTTGTLQFRESFEPRNVRGVGLTTGAIYRGLGKTGDSFRAGKVGEVVTYENTFKILGQGSVPDFSVHARYRVTVNEQGVLTASVDHYRETCR